MTTRSTARTLTCVVLSFIFTLGAFLLFTVGPYAEFRDDSLGSEYRLEAECASLAAIGWEDPLLDLQDSRVSHTFTMSPDDLDALQKLEAAQKGDGPSANDQVAAECDRRRTRNAAVMSLLLAPAAVFAAVGVRSGRRREEEDPEPEAHAQPAG